ncbi:MAG TPA: PAS domain S-box protein [Gammaproteobacteria bacterium]|nr:PAS domain S-box protein [Gammaproteobacteria bacterium]
MKSYIARKLIVYTILFSSVITLIITAIQLYTEFQYDVKGIYQRLDQIKISYQKSITQSAWLSDREQLKIILDGITELPDIAYSKIVTDNNAYITSGEIPLSENIKMEMELHYAYNNKMINIGEFTVVASLSGIYDRLLNRFWIILLSNALKTSLVAVFIYFLFSNLVTRHLVKISDFTERHNALSNVKNLTLDRPEGKVDEFDVLVESINDMQARLYEQVSEISYQKQYLSQTLNSIGDAVITTDHEGNITSMNPVAEALTGWLDDEARGKALKCVFKIVNASTRDPIENPVEKVLASGETIYLSNHTTLIAKDDREHQIADSAAPIRNGDNILGIVLVFNDVTEQYKMREELKSKEQEQREILQSMVDGVITIDEKGIVHSFNHSAEKMFGYLVEEISGKNINCLMPPPYASLHDAYLHKYTITGEKSIIGKGRDLSGLRKNGETFPMHLLVAELPRDLDGNRRFIGSCIDLTEQKKNEEQLRRTQKMDALGKLTGGIAHDYNNMLGVVLGYSELLQGKLEGQSKLQEYVSNIIRAGERGAKLTRKLLTFSRERSIDIEKLDINRVIREEQDMLEKTLTARIKLEFRLGHDLWPVYLDESELEDAVLNMSINAMHSIEGNGQLTIETSNEKVGFANTEVSGLVPGDYVRLDVSDNGCGMSEAIRERIFEPFFSTKGDKGTGLGLSQVYGFVNRSGGVIRVDTSPGKGSVFSLYFPRYQGESVNVRAVENSRYTDINTEVRRNVLVVDDEPALLNLAREILNSQNYRVFYAEGAKQALEILQVEKIDVLISDIIMPYMDGYTLASHVQEKYPNVRIQLVSGFSGEENLDSRNEQLSQELIYKPYSAGALLARIQVLLQ